MAVRVFSMPSLSIHRKPNPTPSTSKRVFIYAKADSEKRSSPPIQIKSTIKLQKVFEDKSSGIVCYKDDKGEVICEGYDEGPRLPEHWFSSHRRDAEAIIRLLKRSLLQVIGGAGKVN
ncbi:hypothetical protein L2E82_16396 [Cichorium intybus]|uniref:Uncharacterized protein n=1 Tax=Cichorium intybus TaxID=13427 RepID=A0ACB9F5F3_CICIN|nr:hypothetical protein L1887_10774 [Cichorium endivia]KAI3766342.1 hypothetical protein L2E82_16396 [Cichorium intybus]